MCSEDKDPSDGHNQNADHFVGHISEVGKCCSFCTKLTRYDDSKEEENAGYVWDLQDSLKSDKFVDYTVGWAISYLHNDS